jgi:hypothetical protein
VLGTGCRQGSDGPPEDFPPPTTYDILPIERIREEIMRGNQKKSRTTMIYVVGACLIFLAAAILPNAGAQNPPGPAGRYGRGRFADAARFGEGKVVTGAPYSAQAVTEHTQTLPDGNAIHTTTTVNVYRDSQGRTRREQEIGAIGPWATQGSPHKVITITDPVGRFIHMLNPDTQLARQMPFRAHMGAWGGAGTPREILQNPDIKTESLGTQ